MEYTELLRRLEREKYTLKLSAGPRTLWVVPPPGHPPKLPNDLQAAVEEHMQKLIDLLTPDVRTHTYMEFLHMLGG